MVERVDEQRRDAQLLKLLKNAPAATPRAGSETKTA